MAPETSGRPGTHGRWEAEVALRLTPCGVRPTAFACRLSQLPQRSGRLMSRVAEAHHRSCHLQVTPEAHRELNNALERGAQPPAGATAGGVAAGPGGAGKGEDPRNLAPVVLMDEG